MRKVKVGVEHNTEVCVMDEPGAGGACHEYSICRTNENSAGQIYEFAEIHFQNGPIQENGTFESNFPSVHPMRSLLQQSQSFRLISTTQKCI